MNTQNDAGLALLVLNSCAQFYAARGQFDQAAELSGLVAGHLATWKEIRAQALELINQLKSVQTQYEGAVKKETTQQGIWTMIDHLLETDFRPI